MGRRPGVVALMGVLIVAACSGAQVARKAAMPGEPIATDMSLLRGVFVAGRQPDGNTVLLRGRDGLVVVDSGRHPDHAKRIVAAAQGTGQPIVAIVNTHGHLDHVAGNVALRAAHPGVEVFASDAIRGAMSGFLADYRKQLQQAIAQAAAGSDDVATWKAEIDRIDAGERLFATRPVTTTGGATIAGHPVVLGLETNAVSGGDVWLLEPASRVLVAGDLVTLPVPLFDTACTSGWREALDRLQARKFDILVPGHGMPLSHDQFDRYRTAFGHLLQCANSTAAKPQCVDGWLQDAHGLFPDSENALARTSLDYYLDLLRAPDQRLAKRYCHRVDAR